jgi:hypothetical protein
LAFDGRAIVESARAHPPDRDQSFFFIHAKPLAGAKLARDGVVTFNSDVEGKGLIASKLCSYRVRG